MLAVTGCADYMRVYFPFLKKSAQDSNWEVRHVVAEEAALLCSSLGPESVAAFYEVLCRLVEDPQQEVFVSAAESLGLVLGLCKGSAVFKQAVDKLKVVLTVPNVEVLKVTIKNIGRTLVGIGKETLDKDKELKLMLQSIIMVAVEKDLKESGVLVAQNLPAIVSVYGAEKFVGELFRVIERLMSAKSAATSLARAAFAKCFHEIVKLFGFTLATEKLKDYFFSLLGDQDIMVIDSILNHIEIIIEIFASKQDSGAFIKDYFAILPQVHKRVKARSWRSEAKFLHKLTFALPYLNAERMANLLAPIFKTVFASSPRECKLRVCELLAEMLAGYCQWPTRSDIHAIADSLARSTTYQDRISYLELSSAVLKRMSKHYFKENFLVDALVLGEDKVVGVQWKFCCIAGEIKKGILAGDIKNADKLLMIMEKMVKTARCRCLKEKAEATLKELKLKEPHEADNKKEEELFRRERAIMRREIIQQEDTKKLPSEANKRKYSLLEEGKDVRVKKSAHLISSVTAMTSKAEWSFCGAELGGGKKLSMGSTKTPTRTRGNFKPPQERPKTIAKASRKVGGVKEAKTNHI
eukprot:TRINITY_DN3676_c0_g6_i1.p1 TRINITY_DN3676_c0_g6~~TRINITY_DN3676_c0_g6_i1.p1  ORF type:complete len:581 (-),score=128.03 TRINITY_DN3676_c0_g6_i1:50-1792(-)